MSQNPETPIVNTIRLKIGGRPDTVLFRNTVGECKTEDGRYIVYGLGPGTSDIVGWRSVKCGCGRTLAVFTAIEVKAPGSHTQPARLAAQRGFIDRVKKAGGFAGFAHNVEEALEVFK